MTTSSTRIQLDAEVPTSRSAFRRVAKAAGATNREADTLRTALLAEWGDSHGTYELGRRLRDLEPLDDGMHELETLLATWFSFAEPVDGQIVSEDAAVIASLPEAVRIRVAAVGLGEVGPGEVSLGEAEALADASSEEE